MRHRVLSMIIGTQHITTQEELALEMRKAGYPCGQATLSRDLKKLRISKVHTRGGHSVYSLHKDSQFKPTPGRDEANSAKWSNDFSGNILVMHTPPGYASVVASEIDSAKHPMLLGSVAGDDTVIVVLAADSNREEVEIVVEGIVRKFK